MALLLRCTTSATPASRARPRASGTIFSVLRSITPHTCSRRRWFSHGTTNGKSHRFGTAQTAHLRVGQRSKGCQEKNEIEGRRKVIRHSLTHLIHPRRGRFRPVR